MCQFRLRTFRLFALGFFDMALAALAPTEPAKEVWEGTSNANARSVAETRNSATNSDGWGHALVFLAKFFDNRLAPMRLVVRRRYE